MKRRLLLTAAAAFAAAGMGQAQAEDVSAGQAKYDNACAQCHGASGRGAGIFPSLTGRDADYITQRLEQYRAGERVGPNTALMVAPTRNLSDEDIANLAAYIATEFQ